MTCIANADKYKTKKSFLEAIKTQGADRIHIEDPSIVAPFYGTVAQYMATHKSMTVTNHPKRSWFAAITLTADGSLKLS
jgi:hypothetical protein